MALHPIHNAVVDNVKVDKPTFRTYIETREVLVLADSNEIQGFTLPNTKAVIVGAAAYGYDSTDTTSAHNGTSVLVDGTLPTGRRYKPGGIAADSVTNAMLADMAAYSLKVNLTAVAANPTDAVRASFTAVAAATTHRAIGFLATGELQTFDLGNLAGMNTVGTAQINDDAVTYGKIQNISVTQRVLGRNTAAAGDTEEVTATQVLDWIGATQGQILFRGVASWTALAAGTAGLFLRAAGAAANPAWATPLATEVSNTPAGNIAAVTVQAAINELDAEKAGLALANIFSATQTIQSTDALAAAGPIFNLDRFSATPAAADLLGEIQFHGRSSTAVDRIYAAVGSAITSPTNLAEAGTLSLETIQAGVLADRFRVGLGLYYAAGTDQGASTINALNLFVAGANINTIYQPLDSDLTAVAGLAANGIVTRTGVGAMSVRTITGTASQITVTNGDGVAGNPTLSLPADVLIPTILTVPNVGLHLLDTNATHDLIVKPGSDLTLDRTFTLTTGDVDRTLDISAASVTVSAFGATLVDDADAITARATLGLVIGTNVQAFDATLQSISALGTIADRMLYTTGVDVWTEAAITAFARSILDDVDAATARATLGLVIGTNVQAQDATLQSIAALGTAADKIAYTTAVDTWAETTLSAYARTLLDDASAATARGTLGVGDPSYVLRTVGGTAQAITANTGYSLTQIPEFATFLFLALFNNTALDPLLNIDGTGNLPIKGPTGAAIQADEIDVARWVRLMAWGATPATSYRIVEGF